MAVTRWWALLALLGLAGCVRARPVTSGGATLADEIPGLVVVLRDSTPASRSAASQLESARALGADGASVPLRIVVSDPAPATVPRERIWITGALPRGEYKGIDLRFRSPDSTQDAVFLDAPFECVPEGPAVVLIATPRSVDPGDAAGVVRPEFTLVPPQKIASGLLGVVSVEGWGAAALFDKRTGQLSAVIPVGESPAGLALDAARLRAYVAVSGGDAVAVIDLLEQRVRDRVRLRAGDAPRDVAVTPDGRVLLVANSGSDTVSFVDPLSAVELERVAVAGKPVSILMDPDGRRALVVAQRARSVVALNVVTRKIVGSMQTETGPFLARFGGRNGETVLVAHADSPYVTLADAATLAQVGRVYVGIGARALEVDRRSGKIFVARSRTHRIEVFDGASLLPVEEVPVPGEVAWLAVEREGNALGVLLTEAPEARILSLFGKGVLARVPLGPSPFALRFLEAR